jgi:hypothetical protein
MQNLLEGLRDGMEDYVFELLLDITSIFFTFMNSHYLKVELYKE